MSRYCEYKNDALRVCCRCNGNRGENAANFGERGWHPCYHCQTSGVCNCTEAVTMGAIYRQVARSMDDDYSEWDI